MGGEPIKVLLIEDNPGDTRLIKEMLAEARGACFELECADRLSSGLACLAQGRIDVVLLDLGLPDSRGLGTLVKVQAEVLTVPVVVLTGLDDEALAVEAVKEGAQDYLVKGEVDSNLLGRSIRYAIERKRAEETLRQLDRERMKSEFISNVSHELRTPLHLIRGFTKLMLEGKVPDPETQKEFLGIVDEQSQRLSTQIASLLDKSRLESGRFTIQKQRLLIRDIIHQAVESFYSLASAKGIVISEDIPATLPEIEADRERLEQVMANLLDNAIKFSNGGRSVMVKGEVKDGELLVQVTDQGIGIPKEAMPHLFERFYRAEDSMARGGAGLGLHISKQIIEAHGGRIWVESKVGKGTTVSFTLPLNQAGGDSYE
jgi:signal transduction histidine kinase